jgi:hypothetical protein
VSRFAENTKVSVAKSKAELERTVTRYGADSFAYGYEKERATVGEEFLAHLMLPNGETVGQNLIPQIENSYEDGTTMPLLPYSG